jgi:hypothetical protein
MCSTGIPRRCLHVNLICRTIMSTLGPSYPPWSHPSGAEVQDPTQRLTHRSPQPPAHALTPEKLCARKTSFYLVTSKPGLRSPSFIFIHSLHASRNANLQDTTPKAALPSPGTSAGSVRSLSHRSVTALVDLQQTGCVYVFVCQSPLPTPDHKVHPLSTVALPVCPLTFRYSKPMFVYFTILHS